LSKRQQHWQNQFAMHDAKRCRLGEATASLLMYRSHKCARAMKTATGRSLQHPMLIHLLPKHVIPACATEAKNLALYGEDSLIA
jgi:hypothetical protein